MDDREVYPSAPVAMVLAEVKHPPAGPLTAGERSEIKRQLSGLTPIMRTIQQAQVGFGAQPFETAGMPSMQVLQVPRYVNRDNTLAISMRPDAVVIETTDYPGWEGFREIVEAATSARMETAPVDGLERLGLRYVDEIRIPNSENPNWRDWLSPSLTGPSQIGEGQDLELSQWEGYCSLKVDENRRLVIRYGNQDGGTTGLAGDLRRRFNGNGKFFWLDIDSFWESTDQVPEFNATKILEISDRLHEPIRTTFESLITDKLRNEVLRVA